MTLSIRRSAVALTTGIALIAAALLAAPRHADAATIYACKKRDGTIRLVGKKTRCRRGQKKIKWSTVGPAGRNGLNGSNGSNGAGGANGQPQRMVRFSATQANDGRSTTLFTADGVTYSLRCTFALILNVGDLRADGPSGQFYGLGVFERPAGITTDPNDIRTDMTVGSLGGGSRSLATTTTGSLRDGSTEFLSVWTLTVEGPTSTTWIHATFDTASSCSIRGTAITVPN